MVRNSVEIYQRIVTNFMHNRQADTELKWILQDLAKMIKTPKFVPLVAKVDEVGVHQGKACLIDVCCELLAHKNVEVYSPAVEFIGQVLSLEDDIATDRCLKHDALPKLLDLTYDARVSVIKLAAWALGNFVLSSYEHAAAFVGSHALDRTIALCSNPNVDIKSEALFCICNCITLIASSRECQELKNQGMPSALDLLVSKTKDQDHLISRLVDGIRVDKDSLLQELMEALAVLVHQPAYHKYFESCCLEDQLNWLLTKLNSDRVLEQASQLKFTWR